MFLMHKNAIWLRGFQYRLPLLSADFIIMDINYCSHTDLDVPRVHPFGEIYYGLEGVCTIQVSDGEYTLRAGELLYIGPFVVHHCVFQPSVQCQYFRLSFQVERRACLAGINKLYVEDEISLLENLRRHDVLHAADVCGCDRDIQHLYEEQQREWIGGIIKLQNYVTNFFITALQSFVDVRTRPDQDELLVNEGIRNKAVRIAEHIRIHCEKDLTIQRVADELNYSTRHVQRILSDYFGLGFFELLTLYRLGKAKVLLCRPGVSIEMVAQQSGFGDANKLRRKFKEHLHITPTEYRKRYIADGEA